MAEGNGREVVYKMAAFFKKLKTRTNQQPDIYIIAKPHPYPEPKLNLGML